MSYSHWLILHGAAVWQVALATLTSAGGLTALARARRRAGAEARALRAALGAAEARIEGAREGTQVTLAGTLRAEGKPCARFEDGADAAAASAGPADVGPI